MIYDEQKKLAQQQAQIKSQMARYEDELARKRMQVCDPSVHMQAAVPVIIHHIILSFAGRERTSKSKKSRTCKNARGIIYEARGC